ncbi:MAG: HEAT repeat domain-containing protein [Bdellovibrionota bacterium]
MFSKPVLSALLPLLLLLNGAAAWALTDAEVKQEVEDKISERHPTDTPDWWKALGPGAPRVLIDLFNAENQTYNRLRLLHGLAWFDDPVATQFLKEQAKTAENGVYRQAAIRTLGISQGDKELDFIASFLKNSDPQTRLAAAETLQKINTPASNGRLSDYLKDEPAPWIVTRLQNNESQAAARPAGALTAGPSLNRAFDSLWRGYWVEPVSGPKGLVSKAVDAEIHIQDGSGSSLSGKITFKSRPASENFAIRENQGKDLVSLGKISGGGSPPKEYAAQFELKKFEDSYLLYVSLPDRGVTAVLRMVAP